VNICAAEGATSKTEEEHQDGEKEGEAREQNLIKLSYICNASPSVTPAKKCDLLYTIFPALDRRSLILSLPAGANCAATSHPVVKIHIGDP
jgi:hypothetical protein